ncbi:hypothetical protein SRHO_G00015740 [Serrasalmus rhombeus]
MNCHAFQLEPSRDHFRPAHCVHLCNAWNSFNVNENVQKSEIDVCPTMATVRCLGCSLCARAERPWPTAPAPNTALNR